jgi:hypothetical protein
MHTKILKSSTTDQKIYLLAIRYGMTLAPSTADCEAIAAGRAAAVTSNKKTTSSKHSNLFSRKRMQSRTRRTMV